HRCFSRPPQSQTHYLSTGPIGNEIDRIAAIAAAATALNKFLKPLAVLRVREFKAEAQCILEWQREWGGSPNFAKVSGPMPFRHFIEFRDCALQRCRLRHAASLLAHSKS